MSRHCRKPLIMSMEEEWEISQDFETQGVPSRSEILAWAIRLAEQAKAAKASDGPKAVMTVAREDLIFFGRLCWHVEKLSPDLQLDIWHIAKAFQLPPIIRESEQ